MEYKQKIEYLKKYHDSIVKIKSLEQEKSEWKDIGVNTSPIMSEIHTNSHKSKVEESETNSADIKKRIEAELREAITLRDSVKCCIDGIQDERKKNIVKMRHMSNMTFREISEAVYLSERHVYNLYKEAVNSIDI